MNKIARIFEDGVVRSDGDYITNEAGYIVMRFPKNSLDIPEASTGKIKNFDFKSYFEEVFQSNYENVEITAKELTDTYYNKSKKAKEKQAFYIDPTIDFVNKQGNTKRYNLKYIKCVIDIFGKKVNIQIPSTKSLKPLIISNDEAVALLLPIRVM